MQVFFVFFPQIFEGQGGRHVGFVRIYALLDLMDSFECHLASYTQRHYPDTTDRMSYASDKTTAAARTLPQVTLYRPRRRLLVDDDNEAFQLGIANDISSP